MHQDKSDAKFLDALSGVFQGNSNAKRLEKIAARLKIIDAAAAGEPIDSAEIIDDLQDEFDYADARVSLERAFNTGMDLSAVRLATVAGHLKRCTCMCGHVEQALGVVMENDDRANDDEVLAEIAEDVRKGGE